MRKPIYFSLICVLVFACQTEQRYFRDGPEIELVQKAVQAYVDQDWETYRACFADTARIYSNAWNGGDISPDEDIQNHKTIRANLSSVEVLGWEPGKDPYIEMVFDFDKEKWVSTWFLWRGTLAANSQILDIPVHLACNIEEGKIAVQEVYFNMLPYAEAIAAIEEGAGGGG